MPTPQQDFKKFMSSMSSEEDTKVLSEDSELSSLQSELSDLESQRKKGSKDPRLMGRIASLRKKIDTLKTGEYEAKRGERKAGITKQSMNSDQIRLAAKYFTVSNLGYGSHGKDERDVDDHYRKCSEDHYASGVDITDEYNGWVKDLKKDPHWVEKAFKELPWLKTIGQTQEMMGTTSDDQGR